MSNDGTPRLDARSRQPLWPILLLVPSALLLAWVGWDIGLKGAFETTGRGRWLGYFPALWVQTFFYGCAAVCAACALLALRRRISPNVELTIDQTGITSHLFWGRGTLAWNEITHLTSRDSWLFVHGRPANTPKPKKLIVSLTQLDRPVGEILGAIRSKRPDLFQ